MPESLMRKLSLGARSLRKTPVFTAAVVLTLALAIGANSAVFSAIDAVLLRPLPFPEGDQLVRLAQFNPKSPQQHFVAPVRLEDWNRLNSTLQAITGYYVQDDTELSGELPEKVRHAFVAPRFLQVWGVAPELGRDFTPQEEHFGGPPAALISDRLWRRKFGGDPHAIGRPLRLGRSSVTVVGVMPPSFLFPDRDADIWSPSPQDAPFAQSRELTWYETVGRMKPGVTVEQARANLAAVQANLGREFPKPDAQLTVTVNPLKEKAAGGMRRSLWILFGAVTLLLLIACTNIAGLLLSRAAGRQREIAVRFSLGASRASVGAQLLCEVLLLAVAGAGVGLAMAGAAVRAFRGFAHDLPRFDEIALDWRIVLYSLACALAATLLCGILPAVRATRGGVAAALAQAGRAQVGGRGRAQRILVGVQIALAVTLLAGAGLLVRSFEALARVSPGFQPDHVLTFHLSTSWAESNDRPGSRQRTERVLDALRAIPGIEAAATALVLPGIPDQYQVELKTSEGRAGTQPRMLAQDRVVTPDYFTVLRIPLLTGELCRNDLKDANVVVNRSFANAYLGGGGIGLHLLIPGDPYTPVSEIRGIVGDARETGLDREPVPTVYWCTSAMQPGTYFLVRTHADPASMAQTVRRRLATIEPNRSVYDLTPLAGKISDAYAQNRLRTVLLSFFALTAIVLACVGLYGTLSYLVYLRRREIGLRLAVGAVRARIVGHFVFAGLRIGLAGAVVGLALAAAFTRVLAGMLYGVSPWDPGTMAAVLAGVLAVALLASLVPSIRAARLDPMEVLREE